MSKYELLFGAKQPQTWISQYFGARGSADLIICADFGNSATKLAIIARGATAYINIQYQNSWVFLNTTEAKALMEQGQGGSILEYDGEYIQFGAITEANPIAVPVTLDQKFDPKLYRIQLVAAIASAANQIKLPASPKIIFVVTHATPQASSHAGCVANLEQSDFFGSQINYSYGGVTRTATIVAPPIRRQESLGAVYGSMWQTKEARMGSDLAPNRTLHVSAEGPYIRLCDLGGGTGIAANVRTIGGVEIVDVQSSAIGVMELITPTTSMGQELISIIRSSMLSMYGISYTVPFTKSMLRDVLKRGGVHYANVDYPLPEPLVKFLTERLLSVYKGVIYDPVANRAEAKFHLMTGAGVILLGPALPIALNLVGASQKEDYAREWYLQREKDNLLMPQAAKFGYAESKVSKLEYANINGQLFQFFVEQAAIAARSKKNGTQTQGAFSVA